MDTKTHAAAPFDGGSGRPEHGRGAAPVEGDGVSYSGIVWFIVVLTVTTLVCQGLMWVLLRTFQHQTAVAAVSPVAEVRTEHVAVAGRVYPTVTSIGPSSSAQPKLLVNEPGYLATLRAKEQEALTTYGWSDRNAGIVRIPIDRAKDLLIERGLPVRPAGGPADKDKNQAAPAAKDIKK